MLLYSSSLTPSLYLKELHSNASKHELQQRGDDHDVADSPDGHKDALDHMLQKKKQQKKPPHSVNVVCCQYIQVSQIKVKE